MLFIAQPALSPMQGLPRNRAILTQRWKCVSNCSDIFNYRFTQFYVSLLLNLDHEVPPTLPPINGVASTSIEKTVQVREFREFHMFSIFLQAFSGHRLVRYKAPTNVGIKRLIYCLQWSGQCACSKRVSCLSQPMPWESCSEFPPTPPTCVVRSCRLKQYLSFRNQHIKSFEKTKKKMIIIIPSQAL